MQVPSWGPRDTVASWPWISAIFRPGFSSFRNCTDISRVASSCRTASTSNSLWAPRADCRESQSSRQKAYRAGIPEAVTGLNLKVHASYTTGGSAQGGIGWGRGKHRCRGEGPGRILWGPVTIRRSQGSGEASNLTWPCPRQRSSGPHHSCEEHTCWRHFLSEVWKM